VSGLFYALKSEVQNNVLNDACGDLSEQLTWCSYRLTKDEWRHLICAAILNVRTVRGINGGLVTLGGSSRKLDKEQASDAITMAFSIGDAPWEYEPSQETQVQWNESVMFARKLMPENSGPLGITPTNCSADSP
jgi:hypothetical protein